MTEQWPSYKVADNAVVHALGVMNINFVRFEATQVYMLSAVANISTNQAAVFIGRINQIDRAVTIDRSLCARTWPQTAQAGVEAYLKGMRVLTENRNIPVHGNIVDMAVGKAMEPAIISIGRDGRTTVFSSSPIRQVADDLYSCYHFGSNLSAYLATEFSPNARQAGMLALSECPDPPPLPKPLRSSQPKIPV
jgi:hypothetical protein